MVRKWINSQDVEVDAATGALLVSVSGDVPTILAGDTATMAAAGTARLIPWWATQTAYAAGNVRFDPDYGTTWLCQVGHTSGNGPPSADRSAHPTWWLQITTCKKVLVKARISGSDAMANARRCDIGDVNSQKIAIMPANFEGISIPISDPGQLYLTTYANGDGVDYVVFA